MNIEPVAPPAVETWRKKLRFRAWHRGTLEMDLLLGRFADSCLERFNAIELAHFEEILEVADPILHDWLCGRTAPPQFARNDILYLLLDFHSRRSGSVKASDCRRK